MTELQYTIAMGIILIITIIIYNTHNPVSQEELARQKLNIFKKELEIKHIYWQISEIKRLSEAITKAIESGDMELYRKLSIENDLLRQGFKKN